LQVAEIAARVAPGTGSVGCKSIRHHALAFISPGPDGGDRVQLPGAQPRSTTRMPAATEKRASSWISLKAARDDSEAVRLGDAEPFSQRLVRSRRFAPR
jgi:hypothetical protein